MNIHDNINQKVRNIKFNESKTIILEDYNSFLQHTELLQNGDFATCTGDGEVKIYDGKNKNLKLLIHENQSCINFVKQLKDGNIVICGKKINIIKLENNNSNYKIIQTINLNFSQDCVVELKNENLVFSNPITIYNKQFNEYKFLNQIKNNNAICLLEIKENEIIGSYYDSFTIYDLNTFSIKKTINFQCSLCFNGIEKINENLIGICGRNESGICIFDINIYQIKLFFQIKSPHITTFKVLKDKTWLIAEFYQTKGNINEKRSDISHYLLLDSDEFILINKKDNVQSHYIDSFVELNDGSIVTSSWDNTAKIWFFND